MSEIYQYIDYLGTFVFAITGASIAAKSRFDLFGMLFLAFLTSVGGGTTRDLILGQRVFWTENPVYLYLILLASFSTFFSLRFYEKKARFLLFLDTLGMGTFVVIGVFKTLSLGFNNETAIIMGTVSAVLGGVLRSAFSREFSILQNKELYATVAGIAALGSVICYRAGIATNLSAAIVIFLTFAIRYGALKWKLELPRPRD
jgi:uncharacterized membrane protein YeiH